MSGYARVRPELNIDWADSFLKLCDLEGNSLTWSPEKEWVKAVCFESMASGLYVLTEDDDHYFTCHSSYLEFAELDKVPSEFWIGYTPNYEETIYTITTAEGYIDFMDGDSMWEVYQEAERIYGKGVTIRPSWYDEWECGSEDLAYENGNGCWYDKFGQHHKLKEGKLVNE